MKTWQQAAKDAVIPGLLAGAATSATAAVRGKRDGDSGVASINATSHVLWGDRAAAVEEPTVKHTLPGVLINSAAAIFWTFVFQKLFGAAVKKRGASAAVLGAAATSGLAYVTDYKLVPSRLTPGYEKRVSARSLWLIYGVLAATMAVGTLVNERRR